MNFNDMIGKIINADCLLAMKDIPDKSIDLIYTDKVILGVLTK